MGLFSDGANSLTYKQTILVFSFCGTFGLAILSALLVLGSYLYKKCTAKKNDDEEKPNGCWWCFHNCFFYFGTFCLFLSLLAITAFDFVPFYVSAVLIFAFLLIITQIKWQFWQYWRKACFPSEKDFELLEDEENHDMSAKIDIRKNQRYGDNKKSPPTIPKALLFTFLFLLICCIGVFSSWFVTNTCVAFHPFQISTMGTRTFSSKNDNCTSLRSPCHVYFTFGTQVESELIIHFHSGFEYVQPTVYYSLAPTTNETLDFPSDYLFVDAKKYKMAKLSHLTDRYIYYAKLSGLVPTESYYIIVGDRDDNTTYSSTKKIRMGPKDSDDFNFAIGGDLGYTPEGNEILKLLSTYEPLFFALGGDFSYANGFSACYQRWDGVLDWLEWSLVTPTGYSVPLIPTIGNHECGGFYQSSTNAPFYFPYFTDGVIEDPYSTQTYHRHRIGRNTVFYCLDSDIINSASGEQSIWLNNSIQEDINRKNKLAMYHVGLYPSKRPLDGKLPIHLREAWGPLFDDYAFKIAFENHDHLYKRTKLIYNNTPGDTGTLYMGDGALGFFDSSDNDSPLFEKIVSTNHFMFVKSSRSGLTVQAIGPQNNVFDSTTIN